MLERATSERQLGSRGGPSMDVTQARNMPRLTPNKVANLYSSINGSRNAVSISPASTATSAKDRAANHRIGMSSPHLEAAADRTPQRNNEEHQSNKTEPEP